MPEPAALSDPDGHFPYKARTVAALVEENPALGPAGPDDVRASAEDFTSAWIAEASEAYIEAQAAHLRDATPENAARYRSAAETLVSARRAHRANRVDANGNPVAAIVADGDPDHPYLVAGIRHARAGEVVN